MVTSAAMQPGQAKKIDTRLSVSPSASSFRTGNIWQLAWVWLQATRLGTEKGVHCIHCN